LIRTVLSEEQREPLARFVPGRRGGVVDRAHGRTVARSAALLRELVFGVERFRRWAPKGVFERVFKELSGEPDFEYALIDGTIVKVHRHGTGAKGGLTIRPSATRAAG
jgi:transposase